MSSPATSFRNLASLALVMALTCFFAACHSDDNTPVWDGHFIINVDRSQEGTPQVTVSHKSDPDKVLWQSVAGEPFVQAARGQENIKANRGSYDIEDNIDLRCDEQTVDDVVDSGRTVSISGRLRGSECDMGYNLKFREVSKNQLGFDLEVVPGSEGVNRAFLVYASPPDEGIYGFAEQYTYLNQKGRSLTVVVQEQGIGRGAQPATFLLNLVAPMTAGSWWTTYAVVPQYITSQFRSLFLENSEVSVFNMEPDDRIEIKLFGTNMVGRILNGDAPLDLIREYTDYAGRQKPLPDWINEGAVAGLQGGTQQVYDKLAKLEEHDTPLAAFWLQDWVGKRKTIMGSNLWWNWVLDPTTYPDWNEMVGMLEGKGIRVMAYINPYLANVTDPGPGRPNLFAEAEEKGYLVKNQEGGTYIETSFIDFGIMDFTNPDAVSWYEGIIQQNMIDIGIRGWMADFAESLPFDAVLYSGIDPKKYHNIYPEAWEAVNKGTVEKAGLEDEIVYFTRSGYSKTPGLTSLMWLGDQLVSWDGDDGMRSAVKGMLAGGFSGYALNHSDIGGYTNIPLFYRRSKQLLMRWMELAAFTAAYRTHEGLRPGDNAQFYTDNETYDHFARFAKVYKALAPYRKARMQEAADYGWPLARHPILNYPNDPNVYDLEYQWMLGEDFMVAPVLYKNKATVDVYLPEGKWVHLWTQKVYESKTAPGEWIKNVPAPMGQPGVFYPEGSEAGADLVEALKDLGVL